MVAQAGQPSGWPVAIEAGFSPPSGLPPERENSGGGNNHYSMEVAPMATPLTLSHPQFIFVFAAVRRSVRKPRVCMLRTLAAYKHIAHLPVAEVHA